MTYYRYFLCLLLLFQTFFSFSQTYQIDSLKQVLGKTDERLHRAEVLLELAKKMSAIHADSSEKFIEQGISLLREGDDIQLRYETYMALASIKSSLTKNQEMLEAAEKAQTLAFELGDSLLIAKTFRSMALSVPAVSRNDARTFILRAIDMIEDSTEELKRFEARNYEYYAYLIQFENPKRAFSYRRKVLKQALDMRDSTLIASSYNGIALYYRNFNADSAIYFFKSAISINSIRNKKSILASNYVNIATCYQVKDYKDSVIFFAEKALKLGRETRNISPIRQGLRLFLAHYRDAKDYETALENAEEMLKLDEEFPSGYRSMIWLDFASIYKEMGQAEKAIEYLEKARDRGLADKYPPSVATAYAYLGEVHMELKNLDKAKEYFLEGDKMYERMNIEAARLRSFQRLGEIALLQKEFGAARQNFTRLLDISTKLSDLSSQSVAYQGLAKCDSASGNSKAAYDNLLNFAQLQDSFSRQNFTEEVAKMQTRFEAEKKEAEIESLGQKNQIQQLELRQTSNERNFAYLVAGFLALTAIAIVYFLLRLRKNKEQIQAQAHELEGLNKTKDRLFGIIAHDLRGPVSGFQTLGKIFSYHIKHDNKEKLLALTDHLEKQGLQVKNLLDNLLQWSIQQLGAYKPQWEQVLLKPLGKEVIELYEESSKAKENTLELSMEEDLRILGDKNGLFVVLNNLMSNAIKFTEKGSIRILAQKRQEQLHIEVIDTGRGMTPEQIAEFHQKGSLSSQKGSSGEKGTGLGLNLVQQIIQQWGGEINIESELSKGTRVLIDLPFQVSA